MKIKATFEIADKEVDNLTERLAESFEPTQQKLFPTTPENHLKPWTDKHRSILRAELNTFIQQLAVAKGRTTNAIYWAIRRELSVPLWEQRI